MFKLFSKKEENTNDFAAVVSGKIIPLTAVNDDVFSKGMMGTGVAIVPDDDVIVAPCDGEVTMLFPTMHAFGMKNEDGVEILVHIGIDTVNKQGVGFKIDYRLTESLILTFEGFQREGTLQIVLEDVTAQN